MQDMTDAALELLSPISLQVTICSYCLLSCFLLILFQYFDSRNLVLTKIHESIHIRIFKYKFYNLKCTYNR